MEKIIGKEFGGERPLYNKHGLYLENVTIHEGESALKETSDITAEKCVFEGKYPLWCCDGLTIRNCHFSGGARAGIWYTKNMTMEDTWYDAPKGFRELDGAKFKNILIPTASETFWSCRNVEVENVKADYADYIFMHCDGLKINGLRLNGNYSFQWSKNIEIRNSVLNTKDAFWETDNVTVYDSKISGEYLGWHSRNLKLVRCHISGEQPLCYVENLILEDCTFGEDANLALEYSSVQGNILGHVHSIKNPRTGSVTVGSVGEIILNDDAKAPADCKITVLGE